MTIDAIMSRNPITVKPRESLLHLQSLMHERGIRHLLVAEDGRLQGIISDRDVLRAISPFLNTLTEQERDVATLTRSAAEIMTTSPVTVQQNTPIEDATDLMLEHGISCLPVVSEDGGVAGIVTSKDILRYASKQRADALKNS